jgi:hypothetical protein
MSDATSPETDLQPELVIPAAGPEEGSESVHQPAKVMRIASMARVLLDELRQGSLDEPGRTRLREIYETSVRELGEVLSPDLREELAQLSLPFDDSSPSDAELRVAHAQLVGWLEGLFHGIQAMLFAQQAEARQRIEEMRRRSLPAGDPGDPAPEGQGPETGQGTYL